MPGPSDQFNKLVQDAVADLAEHGFDSAERVAYWERRLREAAEKVLRPPAAMEKMLRDTLASIYRRLVDRGIAVEYHEGVGRFTLDRIKPSLRAELDRRIMASANLIRLNREEAIQKTLRRFSGWSTSIPKGGSETVDRREAKASIRKAMQSLPFEERRVIIDQGHKLNASINDIIAKDSGAVAAEWHSHWRQSGYNYRPDHKERDGKIYLLRGSWAREQGLVKPGDDGYSDEITQPAEEPFCRCFYRYIYSLGKLPADMLTAKGAKRLEEARNRMAAA